MHHRALLLSVILLAGGFAGCIGSDTGGDDETTEPQSSVPENDTNVSETEPSVQRTWTNETFEGTISGASLPTGDSVTNGDTSQSFTAASGIAVLFLNLTAEGGAVDMTIGGPNCDVSGNTIPPCAETVSTSGGEASYVNETAQPGEWQTRFSVGDPAGAEVSYTLNVVQGVDQASNT